MNNQNEADNTENTENNDDQNVDVSSTDITSNANENMHSESKKIEDHKKGKKQKNKKVSTKKLSKTEEKKRFAIIHDKGKQYSVYPGKKLIIDLLETQVGDQITFDKVLYVSSDGEIMPLIGKPFIDGAIVKATVSRQVKAKKVIIFKKVNRNGYSKKQGHRQKYTEIVIDSMSV